MSPLTPPSARAAHHESAHAAAGLAAWGLSLWAARALGGVSGDVLGAIEQVGEVLTLLVAVATIARGFAGPFA